MGKYKVLAAKILTIITKIIFAIAMITTGLAALITFGSLFRSEIAFSSAIQMWGICLSSWFCFIILRCIKFKK